MKQLQHDKAAGLGRRDFLKASAGAAAALARKASAQDGSRPGSIDLHAHWAPESYTKAMAKLGEGDGGDPNPLSFDLDKRRKWMDARGVQMHVLTLSGRMPW